MLLLLAILACGDPKGDSAVGKELYGNTCAACHGDDGKAGIKVGDVPSSDLTVEVPAQTDEQLTDVMLNGFGAMPAQFTDAQEAVDCLAYLRASFP